MHAAPTGTGMVTRSLRRSVGLLRLLASHGQIGWRLSDLAQRSQLDPATVHRLLNALVDERLVTRVPGSRRYTLGALAFELGLAAAPYFDLDRLAPGRLHAAAVELQGTLFLKVRSGAESVCIARHDGARFEHGLMLEPGGRRPLCLTAGGIAMMLRLPRARQKDIETGYFGALAQPVNSRAAGVRRMLARSRRVGYGLNLGDTAPGICAVAVAVCSNPPAPVASLSLALARTELSLRAADSLAGRLRQLASELAPQHERLRY